LGPLENLKDEKDLEEVENKLGLIYEFEWNGYMSKDTKVEATKIELKGINLLDEKEVARRLKSRAL